jgi:DNA-binding GntR family transcriptional regulator
MTPGIEVRSLREQVYEHLKRMMQEGLLSPGVFLDLGALAVELGISRTPLRDALLTLEADGFVQILPRRGVLIPVLSLERIRDIYEIVGALEAAAVMSAADQLDAEAVERMREINNGMKEALDPLDLTSFYRDNAAFHGVCLDLSPNQELVSMVRKHRARLYDFPPRKSIVADWAREETKEHATLVDLLAVGKYAAAADFLRNVHWSFPVQEAFIRQCYARPQA